MKLVLAAGREQRVLVEAGSMLVVVQGSVAVRFPFAWLAENVVARDMLLRAETAQCLEVGGWIDLVAMGSTEVAILPPESTGLWARVGRMLAFPLGRRAGKFPEKSVA